MASCIPSIAGRMISKMYGQWNGLQKCGVTKQMDIEWFGFLCRHFNVDEILVDEIIDLKIETKQSVNFREWRVWAAKQFQYLIESFQIIQLIGTNVNSSRQLLFNEECMMFALMLWKDDHILQISVNSTKETSTKTEHTKNISSHFTRVIDRLTMNSYLWKPELISSTVSFGFSSWHRIRSLIIVNESAIQIKWFTWFMFSS